jgi:hypothetical protein
LEVRQAEPAEDSRPEYPGLLRALGGPWPELALGVAVAVVSMVFIGYHARNYWFRYDNFIIISNRKFGSLNDWFRPHLDHWLTWTVLLSRGLFGRVGMHYWPWWYVPRLIGHALVAFLVWRTLLYRGADRLIAFGAYLILLVLAVSYFLDALTAANYVLFPCLILVAIVVSEVERPRPRHLVLVGACLLAAISANGYGLSVLLAVMLVTALRRRFLRWAPALVPPMLALVVWYARYKSKLPKHRHAHTVGFVRDAVDSAFVVVRTAVENTLGLPGPLAVLVMLAMVGLLGRLAYERRLGMFDAIMTFTLLLVLATLAYARTTHLGVAETVRYGYACVLVITLLVVPHLRLPSSRIAQAAAAAVLIALVAFNTVSLSRRLDETGRTSQSIREAAETTAALIVRGEPYSRHRVLWRGVDPVVMQRLVNDGWRPKRSPDVAVVNYARHQMHGVIMGDPARRVYYATPHVAPEALGVDAGGCLRVTRPKAIYLRVSGPGSFSVSRRVQVTWTDDRGTDDETIDGGVIGVTMPEGRVTLRVRTFRGKPTLICSLAPVPDAPAH